MCEREEARFVTYVLRSLHDPHLVFHLLIEHAVLHKLSLVEFFGSIRPPVEFCGHLVHSCEGALADSANPVVFAGAVPLPG